MMRTKTSVIAVASLLLAVSIGIGTVAQERGPSVNWRKQESAMRAAELCEGWSQPEKKSQGSGGDRGTNRLTTGERLHAVERGRRDAERLVRDRGCESDEVRGLLAFFHEFIRPLFD